jgi:hypothetical protein
LNGERLCAKCLKLDGIRSGLGGCIYELQGEIEPTVVVDAGLGDNEDPPVAIHSASCQ